MAEATVNAKEWDVTGGRNREANVTISLAATGDTLTASKLGFKKFNSVVVNGVSGAIAINAALNAAGTIATFTYSGGGAAANVKVSVEGI